MPLWRRAANSAASDTRRKGGNMALLLPTDMRRASKGSTSRSVPSPLAGEVRESHHAISSRCKPSITRSILPHARYEIMTFTVKLDDQFARMRDKISDVVAYRNLAPETETRETMRLQMTPKKNFCMGHRATKPLGASALDFGHTSVWHPPLPTLPRKGGGSPSSVL